jgi:hypothetical protein
MRYLSLAIFVLLTQTVRADNPTFDRELVIAAGHAYVDSYLRWHPRNPARALDWSNARIEFVPKMDGSFLGYVGVFAPDANGSGAGFAYFEVGNLDPGYMFPVQWGDTANLSEEVVRFKRVASSGHLPKVTQ